MYYIRPFALLLQVLSDLPFIPQIPQNTQMNNPLMHMISQMQQVRQQVIIKIL